MTTLPPRIGSPLSEASGLRAEPANDNFPVKGWWQTPAEALQTIQRWLEEMREEMRANFTLRACREYRQRWEQMKAMEKCAYWVYFRERRD